ncbi:tetratricopeptide repeat protein [Maribacter sp. LLG6340-A2]|uniref:tetratricopeptide repeat protein n=1 Tax=Maribacter sp. LLG6340-A2 TaxID=3160834 RepID=UPI003869799D
MKGFRISSLLMLCFIFLSGFGCKNKPRPVDISQRPVIGCAPPITDAAWYTSNNKAPLIDGLDVLDFPVTTTNSLAQKYVNQGLVLAYGFNHAEAARSFYYATKLDPNCAMAYWGFAYVLGPNYNAGMEPDNYERAFAAIQKAVDVSKISASQKEKDLIAALAKRYVKKPVSDRGELDLAYSNAMRSVYEKYPFDADVATIYAESIMDLHPWDLWDKNGVAREWTVDILSVLKRALRINPKHAGAHHFYIHTVETSLNPEDGLDSAKLFDEDLVAGAGHLVHMSSHIYIRTGDYHKGTLANIRAIAVDSSYVSVCNAQGAYPLSYFPHNYHFMAATATLEGNSKLALEAANKVAEHSNLILMKESGWGTLQHYYTIPYYVYVKFGKWDDILQLENKDSSLKYPEAVRNYARGMAFLGKGDVQRAKTELESLEIYAKDESLRSVSIWDINSVDVLLQIAKRVLNAEILAQEANYTESIALLNEAVKLEDNLNYNEPPDWFFSVRHHLGAIQIEAANYNEAIETYEEDLKRLPRNGWALHGLKLAYEKLNEPAMVSEIDDRLKTSWATADTELTSSRIQ